MALKEKWEQSKIIFQNESKVHIRNTLKYSRGYKTGQQKYHKTASFPMQSY